MRVPTASPAGEFARLLDQHDLFAERVRADPELAAFAAHAEVTIGIASDARALAFRVAGGEIVPAPPADADTTMFAPDGAWDGCLAPRPAPTLHHFLAMRMRVEQARIEGSELAFAQHAHIARRLIVVARATLHGESELPADPVVDRSGIRASHLSVQIEGETVSLGVEEAGDPTLPVLLVLHTAGADSRQAHPIMADPAVTNRYRVVAFDLPGHGRSGRMSHSFGGWSLSTDRYIASILGVIAALELERPILVGASMAGEVCLAMAHLAPESLGGVIACEAADHVPGRLTPWPKDPRVNAMVFAPEWIDGLIGPYSPRSQREEIRWQYSQGGFGTLSGDIDFYSGGWDGRDIVSKIDTAECPVVMMTGEYDYSCTPAMSAATAARITGARYWEMAGLGHFPICEHPDAFAPHLAKALAIIEQSGS